MRKLISFIAATSLFTLTYSQSVFLPTNFGNIAIDNSASPTDNPGVITFPTTNIFTNSVNDLSNLSLDLPSIQLNTPTETTTTPETTNTEESMTSAPEAVTEESTTSVPETITELTPMIEENEEIEEVLTESMPVIAENENTNFVIPGGFDFGEGLPIIPEESGDIITDIPENNDFGNLLENTLENSAVAAAVPASTVKCDFNEVGQLTCQTCYYQAGCFGIDCPIDHCE